MLKPPIPNIPGVGAVTDTLDFVKNLWGSMSVPGMNFPGMAVPTLSVDDLDKKIADLKAVESWLNVNVAMLRGTIQTLEIQRGTLSTLKSMGATLANAVRQPGADEKSVLAAAPFASAFFTQPSAAAAAPSAPQPASAEGAGAAEDPASALANPAMWWNMLQDQFQQAVANAMTPDAKGGDGDGAGTGTGKEEPMPDAAAPAKPRSAKPKTDKG